MRTRLALKEDLSAVADLVNSAYRGQAAREGWTHEADLLEGQRTDPAALAAAVAAPGVALLLLEGEDGLMGSALLEPEPDGAMMIGMLTVKPGLQAKGLGRRLLDAAEGLARSRGAERARMTVISVRESLIAWYGRRGYAPTGASKPFPQDPAVGRPVAGELSFIVLEKALS